MGATYRSAELSNSLELLQGGSRSGRENWVMNFSQELSSNSKHSHTPVNDFSLTHSENLIFVSISEESIRVPSGRLAEEDVVVNLTVPVPIIFFCEH